MVVIEPYNPLWPDFFEREARRIRAVLGETALRLEHIGSTSVPGLAAKPVIDVLLEVADSAAEASYAPGLEREGYILRIREPDWHEHRMFNGPDTPVNLHVYSAGCPEVAKVLLFRDWLRGNPSDREAYAAVKIRLAGRAWRSVQDYADAKTEIVAQILARAGYPATTSTEAR